MYKSVMFILTALLVLTAGQAASAADAGVEVRFGTEEALVIRAYYAAAGGHESPGRKAAKSLPPGIAKNLARGKPLPPGIAKQSLPADLSGRLPPVPRGFERIVVDGRVLLVEIATHVIHDVLSDLLLD